jgi:hypothetical protein
MYGSFVPERKGSVETDPYAQIVRAEGLPAVGHLMREARKSRVSWSGE